MSDLHFEAHPEYRDKWERFIEGINTLRQEVFSPEDESVIVIGAQWGEMGSDSEDEENGLPLCVVTANLPVCVIQDALADMGEYAAEAHETAHAQFNAEHISTTISADQVPEEVRQAAMELVESMGLPPEAVQFIRMDDISDLDNMEALFEVGGAEPSDG